MKIRYSVQLSWKNSDWDDRHDHICTTIEDAKSCRDEFVRECRHNENMLKEHPKQTYPMIGVTGVRIVKQTINEEVIEEVIEEETI